MKISFCCQTIQKHSNNFMLILMFGMFCFFSGMSWIVWNDFGFVNLEFLNFGVIWNCLELVAMSCMFLFFWEWFGFLWTDVFFRFFCFMFFNFFLNDLLFFFDFGVWMIQKVWYLWVSVSFKCSGMFWKIVWTFWHDAGRFWMCWKFLECFGVCSGRFPYF